MHVFSLVDIGLFGLAVDWHEVGLVAVALSFAVEYGVSAGDDDSGGDGESSGVADEFDGAMLFSPFATEYSNTFLYLLLSGIFGAGFYK